MVEKKLFILMIIWGIGAALVSLYLPILYANIIDVISSTNYASRNQILPELLQIVLLIGIFELWSIASRRLVGFTLIPLEIRWIKRIFAESFKYLHRHSYTFFTNSFGWALVKKVNKLAYSYERMTDIFIFSILRLAIFLPIIIITIFLRDYRLWLIFFVFITIFAVLQYVMYKKI